MPGVNPNHRGATAPFRHASPLVDLQIPQHDDGHIGRPYYVNIAGFNSGDFLFTVDCHLAARIVVMNSLMEILRRSSQARA
jgi:hypothetical protein